MLRSFAILSAVSDTRMSCALLCAVSDALMMCTIVRCCVALFYKCLQFPNLVGYAHLPQHLESQIL